MSKRRAQREETPPAEPIELIAETLLGELLKATVEEIKAAPDVWQKLSERAQQDVIDRMTAKLATLLQRAVELIASDARPTIVADVESVTFKDGIKAVVTCSKANPARHELADAAGCTVLLVIADAGAYLGGTEVVQADPDQQNWLGSPPGTPAPTH